jgi:hypothetical protein
LTSATGILTNQIHILTILKPVSNLAECAKGVNARQPFTAHLPAALVTGLHHPGRKRASSSRSRKRRASHPLRRSARIRLRQQRNSRQTRCATAAGQLTRQPDASAALAGAIGGALLEGWVVVEAVKALMALGRRPDLHFWRSHAGLEVDLLIAIGGKLQPVEIKLAATPSANQAEPLARFIDIVGGEAAGPGIVASRTEKARPRPKSHLAMPWHSFPGWLRARLAEN